MAKPSAFTKSRRDKREGKSVSTQAGEFVHEEIELIRSGAHGVRSTQQAIAIGLSKARRAGVKLPAPKRGSAPEKSRKQARRDLSKVEDSASKPISRKRSRATLEALKRERTAPVSKAALARQAHASAGKRSSEARSAAAKKAALTRRRVSLARTRSR